MDELFTQIKDNSIVTLKVLKQYLHIDQDETSYDLVLKLALNAAKESADDYCQNPFYDRINEDGSIEIPGAIEMWILQVIAIWLERKGPGIKAVTFEDIGRYDFEFNYHDYYHLLKPHRWEVGYA